MIGLLWFDDSSQRSLEEKLEQAAKRYVEKFGRPPNVCYVHPSVLGESVTLDITGIRLRVEARRWVLRDHLLVGEDENTGTDTYRSCSVVQCPSDSVPGGGLCPDGS